MEVIKTIFSYNFFKVFIYFVFVFSGLLKWIPLPADITLISVILCIAVLFIELRTIIKFQRIDRTIILLIIILIILFFLSNFYTISRNYADEKSVAMILNLFTVIYPVFAFKNSIFREINYLMFIVGTILCSILFYFYQLDMFVVLFFDQAEAIGNVPTYLSIGILLSACFLFSLNSKYTRWIFIYQFAIIFLLMQLGGRGPVYNLVICLIVFFFLYLHKLKFNYKTVLGLSVLALGLLFYLPTIINYLLETVNFDRFNVLKASMEDESFLVRFHFLSEAWNAFLEKPFFGHGIGSGGLILRGEDLREFPHNLFVESLMELGIIGGILYLLIYLLFFLRNLQLARNVKALRVLFIATFLFFLEDNKSGSFDAWRIALFWIMIFIIERQHYQKQIK